MVRLLIDRGAEISKVDVQNIQDTKVANYLGSIAVKAEANGKEEFKYSTSNAQADIETTASSLSD